MQILSFYQVVVFIINKLFFKEIKLKDLLENYNNLVIGGSAGAMDLGKKVLNFPITYEEIINIDKDKCFLDGIDIHNQIIVPHFNGITKEYIRGKNINAYDYLLDLSIKNELIAFDNDSYILVDKDKVSYYGNIYLIKDKTVTKLNNK